VNLRIAETEPEKAVVVLDDIVKRCESPVVVERLLQFQLRQDAAEVCLQIAGQCDGKFAVWK
jgi:hypothetical protein